MSIDILLFVGFRERQKIKMLTFRPQNLFQLSFVAALTFVFPLNAHAQTPPNSSPQSPGSVASTQSPDADLRSEVEHLTQLVRDQQKRIDALEAGRQTAPSHPAVSASPTPSANDM